MIRRELVNSVKTRIDELSPLDGLVVTMGLSSDKPIDSFIEDVLDECGREVLMKAPLWRVDGVLCGNIAVSRGDGSGYVMVPDDFLRLVEFRMSEWRCSVRVVYDGGSDVARKQGNRFLRGGVCKPVCVFGHVPGGRVIEYFSVKGLHKVECFLYVRDVAAECVGVDLQDVVVWFCASRILGIVGKVNEAKMAYDTGLSLL